LKKINNTLLAMISILSIGCATQKETNQSQIIIDPAYNFVSDKSSNKLTIGTLVYFKVDSLSNNKLNGYLLNNIFNVDDNIILFKMGDSITADYNINKGNCGLTNVIIKNSNGFSAPITDFYLMKDDLTYTCSIKNQIIKANEIYNLNITSVSNIPHIGGGVGVPDIYEQLINNQLDTAKQYKIISSSKLQWLPLSIADNGIQTIIKLPSGGGGAHLPSAFINNKLIPINSSFSHKDGFDYTIIDGIYSNIVLNNLVSEPFSEVHILRANLPDSQNTIVNNLFAEKLKMLQNINLTTQNTLYQQSNVGVMSSPSQVNQVTQPDKQNTSETILYKQPTEKTNIIQNNNTPPLNTQQSNEDSNYSPMGVNIMGKLNFNNN
jgi:hypothetical protein